MSSPIPKDRSAEFEDRYEALKQGVFKQHSPSKLEQFWLDQLSFYMLKAEAFRGVDGEKFGKFVSSAEKAMQTVWLLGKGEANA